LVQALTNLLQNAADSIQARVKADGPGAEKGRIKLVLSSENRRISISVEDNGIGLPRDIGRDITDPYVTTRAEGTGLGLAIVRKIMEDHGGELTLEDGLESGAKVSLIFRATGPRGAGGNETEQIKKIAESKE